MAIRKRESRRDYQRKWEREKMKDPNYRAAHNARKLKEQKLFRKNNPEIQKQRDHQKWFWKAYRVTVQWYELKLKEQNDSCAICGGVHKHNHWRSGRICPLHVDHNHTTGKARGLLCVACNKRMGEFEIFMSMSESVNPIPDSWLAKAMAYLERYKVKT